MTTILAVHGTEDGITQAEILAAGGRCAAPKWWEDGGALQQDFARYLDGAFTWSPFLWDVDANGVNRGGRNQHSVREAGAQRLYGELRRLGESGETVYLIAHSHGGNVAAGAVRRAAAAGDALNHVARIVTVGTPFLTADAFGWLKRFWRIWAAVFAASLIPLAGLLSESTAFDGVAPLHLATPSLMVIAVFLVRAVIGALLRRRSHALRDVRRQDLDALFGARLAHLFAENDEAIAALEGAQKEAIRIAPRRALRPLESIIGIALAAWAAYWAVIDVPKARETAELAAKSIDAAAFMNGLGFIPKAVLEKYDVNKSGEPVNEARLALAGALLGYKKDIRNAGQSDQAAADAVVDAKNAFDDAWKATNAPALQCRWHGPVPQGRWNANWAKYVKCSIDEVALKDQISAAAEAANNKVGSSPEAAKAAVNTVLTQAKTTLDREIERINTEATRRAVARPSEFGCSWPFFGEPLDRATTLEVYCNPNSLGAFGKIEVEKIGVAIGSTFDREAARLEPKSPADVETQFYESLTGASYEEAVQAALDAKAKESKAAIAPDGQSVGLLRPINWAECVDDLNSPPQAANGAQGSVTDSRSGDVKPDCRAQLGLIGFSEFNKSKRLTNGPLPDPAAISNPKTSPSNSEAQPIKDSDIIAPTDFRLVDYCRNPALYHGVENLMRAVLVQGVDNNARSYVKEVWCAWTPSPKWAEFQKQLGRKKVDAKNGWMEEDGPIGGALVWVYDAIRFGSLHLKIAIGNVATAFATSYSQLWGANVNKNTSAEIENSTAAENNSKNFIRAIFITLKSWIETLPREFIPLVSAALFILIFGLYALATALLVSFLFWAFDRVFRAVIDRSVRAGVRAAAFGLSGKARASERVTSSGANPDFIDARKRWRALPEDAAAEIVKLANQAAGSRIGELRDELTAQLRKGELFESGYKRLLSSLNWDELVHTAYLKAGSFRALLAYLIAETGAGLAPAAALDDAARRWGLSGWLAAAKPDAGGSAPPPNLADRLGYAFRALTSRSRR